MNVKKIAIEGWQNRTESSLTWKMSAILLFNAQDGCTSRRVVPTAAKERRLNRAEFCRHLLFFS